MAGNAGSLHWTASTKIIGLKLVDFLPTDRRATVVWEQPNYNFKQFNLKVSVNGKEPTEHKTTLPVFVVNNLKPDHRYCLQVSIDEDQYHAVSELLHFATAPDVVKNVEIRKISLTARVVNWEKVPGADSYIVKLNGGQNIERTIETETPYAALSDLSPGATFLCRVAAKSRVGIGLFSNSVTFHTDFQGPQNIQSTIDYVDGKANVKIHFEPMTRQDIAKYHVRLSRGEEYIDAVVDENCAAFTDVEFGSSYTPSVVAETAQDLKSKRSYGTSFWTKPGKVEKVKTDPESTSVEKVGWQSVRGAQSYIVRYGCDSTDTKDDETQDREFLIPNLPPSTTLFVQIIAKNSGGLGIASDKRFFNTALAPPSALRLEDKSDIDRLRLVAHWHSCKNATKYAVDLINARTLVPIRRTDVDKTWHAFVDLQHGSEYYCMVKAIADSELRSSEFVTSETIWTKPPQVTDLTISSDSSLLSRLITWKYVPHATFVVRIHKAGDQLRFIPTERNEYHLKDLKRNSTYTVSVCATNQAGESEESERRQFETALEHPRNIRIEEDSNKSIVVRFDEPDVPANRYQLRPISFNGRSPEKMIISRQEASTPIRIRELAPGTVYQLAIRSLHDSVEELNSEEILSTTFRTSAPEVVVSLEEISRNHVAIKWDPVPGVTSYKAFMRIEHSPWQVEETSGSEKFFPDLQLGTNYEFKVSTVNSLGADEESRIVYFKTAPVTPKTIQAESLSPSKVQIQCDPVVGADRYVFKINDLTFSVDGPFLIYRNDGKTEILKITVQAASEEKISPPSNALLFQQDLLHLKKKALRSAKNKEDYIPPQFKDLQTGELHDEFGKGEFSVVQGETCLVVGDDSTGKTSACCHYMRTLSKEKLGFYLDYHRIKSEKVDVEGFLLKSFMADIQPEKAAIVMNWMKSHSELVVFVVDNFDLESNFRGEIVQFGEAVELKQIFYNLVCKEREIYPDSTVLCTSHMDHVGSIINPSKSLEIIGFDKDRIQRMKDIVLGERYANERLLEAVEYFCVNPCYCKLILRALKTGKPVDFGLYSPVLLEILADNMERYTNGERTDKLTEIVLKIEGYHVDIQSKAKSTANTSRAVRKASTPESETASCISEMPSLFDFQAHKFEEKTCRKLQDDITKSLYYSFFCHDAKFKPVIREGGAALTITSGLLREDSMYRLERFLGITGKKPVDANKKRKTLKQYIDKHMKDGVQSRYCTEHEVALYWLQVIAETNDQDLMKGAAQRIKISNSLSPTEVNQIEEYLAKLPGKFCPNVRVAISDDISPEIALAIESGIKRNANKEMIEVTKNEQSSWLSRAISLRMSTKRRGSTKVQSNPSDAETDAPNGNCSEEASSTIYEEGA